MEPYFVIYIYAPKLIKVKMMKGASIVNNMEIHKKENYLLVSVNPQLYPLQVVYSAAYMFLDKTYMIIGGDPREEIIVELRPKEKSKADLEKLGGEFNNELVNYAVYAVQSARNQEIRDALVKRAFITNNLESEEERGELDYIKDPLGIKEPWKQPEEEDEKSSD